MAQAAPHRNWRARREPEHILLELIREGEGIAANVLESLNISLDAARYRVEEIIGQGRGRADRAHPVLAAHNEGPRGRRTSGVTARPLWFHAGA